jgi:hypothetical protein
MATFGYTTLGASVCGPRLNQFFGYRFTTPSDMGTVTGASVAICSDLSTGKSAKLIIVKQSDLTIVSNGVSNAISIPYDADAHANSYTAASFATAPALSASTDYILGIIHDDSSFSIYVLFDAGTNNYYYWDSSNSYTTPTNPTDAVTTGDDNGSGTNAKMSIYVTYTPAAATTTLNATGFMTPMTSFWGT